MKARRITIEPDCNAAFGEDDVIDSEFQKD
jgi:hypothetical protein